MLLGHACDSVVGPHHNHHIVWLVRSQAVDGGAEIPLVTGQVDEGNDLQTEKNEVGGYNGKHLRNLGDHLRKE
jgi:hypothetical protein